MVANNRNKQKLGKMSIKLDLSGPQGNAFALLCLAQDWMRQLGLTDEKSDRIIKDMKSSDYDNLVKVFAKNFGCLVTLYKDGHEYIVEEDAEDVEVCQDKVPVSGNP